MQANLSIAAAKEEDGSYFYEEQLGGYDALLAIATMLILRDLSQAEDGY